MQLLWKKEGITHLYHERHATLMRIIAESSQVDPLSNHTFVRVDLILQGQGMPSNDLLCLALKDTTSLGRRETDQFKRFGVIHSNLLANIQETLCYTRSPHQSLTSKNAFAHIFFVVLARTWDSSMIILSNCQNG